MKQKKAVSLAIEMEDSNEFLGNIIAQKIEDKAYDLNPNGLPLSSVVKMAVFASVETENNAYVIEEDVVSQQEITFATKTDGEYTFNTPKNISITPIERTFFIYFDYQRSLVEYINEKTIEYVDDAEYETSGDFDTITLGETNLSFLPDFNLSIREEVTE